jgi:chemotaxis protein histidine kinase CheA
VLVVERDGRRYAFEVGCVNEVRALDAQEPCADGRALRDRNGVRVPVLALGDPGAHGDARAAEAVVVLELADRRAAVAVDAVCEVRIPHTRAPVIRERVSSLAQSIGWVAVWDGGEVPVLDVAAWLVASASGPLEPTAS